MEIDKARANEAIVKEWSDHAIKTLAPRVTTQGHAADISSALRDRSHALQPEVCPVATEYQWARGTAAACIILVLAIFGPVLVWPEVLVGAKVYAALGLATVATMVGAFAAFRARAIRRQDAQIPSVVTVEHVDEARLFVRLFGPVVPSDSVGMFILALAGGADATLAGWVLATGMASSLSVIAVLTVSTVVATLFALALRTLAGAFARCCASIRAKLLVRRLADMDIERYPEKVGEAAYAEKKLDPVTGHNFAEPKVIEYVAAAAVLLAVPALFGLLLVFRIYIANHDGAADLQLLLGVSALLATLGMLGATLAGVSGHLLRDEGLFQTSLHKRFSNRADYESWLAAHGRWTRRWANDAARRLNDEIQRHEARGDRRRVQRNIVVPRPFPDVETGAAADPPPPTIESPVAELPAARPANDPSASDPKEVA